MPAPSDDADREAAREFLARCPYIKANAWPQIDAVNALADFLASGRTPPTWTGTPPDREGWYWWRFGPDDLDPWVEWWEFHDDGVLRSGGPEVFDSIESVLNKCPNSQWCPIPEPRPAE